MTKRIAVVAVAVATLAAVDAFANTVVVPARDASPTVVTRPTLVSRTDIVKVRETSDYPDTKVRFKLYPETYGFRATNSSCQGRPFYFTPRRRTNSAGTVVIRLHPPKPLCRGVLYQAEALIGTGDVPDKFAHICVRGRPSDSSAACMDSY